MGDYPTRICAQCGVKHGRRVGEISSWSPGVCDWCNTETSVTEPRDYGYPPAPKVQAP